MRTEEAPPIRLEDYRPPDWLVDGVELDIALDPVATRVRSTLKLRPNENGSAPAPLSLDGESLTLSSIALDDEPLAAEHFVATAERLTIAQPPPRPFQLTIETVVNPSANTQLLGLYRSGRIYCTQCEAEGFRRITYFLDRPDVMSLYTVSSRRTAQKPRSCSPTAISSHPAMWRTGIAISRSGMTLTRSRRYLFALVAGHLALRGRPLPHRVPAGGHARIYVEPGKETRCGYAMDSLKRSMRWDETRLRTRIRSRCFHDRRCLRFQYGRDGKQGP